MGQRVIGHFYGKFEAINRQLIRLEHLKINLNLNSVKLKIQVLITGGSKQKLKYESYWQLGCPKTQTF